MVAVEDPENWKFWDTKLEQWVGSESFLTREYALLVLGGLFARDAQGKRPDLHDKIGWWEVRRVPSRRGVLQSDDNDTNAERQVDG